MFQFGSAPVAKDKCGAASTRPLGGFLGNHEYITPGGSIRTALNKKKRQHRDADQALVIAINVANIFADKEDVFSALYGSVAVELPSGHTYRELDGFWLDYRGPRNGNIPYVIACYRVSPTNVAQSEVVLCPNPYIGSEDFFVPPRIGRYLISEYGRAVLIPGEPMPDILGLHPRWPSESYD